MPLHRKRDGIVQLFGKQGLYTVKLDNYFTRIAKQCVLTYSKNCSRASEWGRRLLRSEKSENY